MKPFDVQNLLDTARQRTDLSDFGQPDCLEDLESVVLSINEKGEIAADRWDAVNEYLIRLLVNRLWFAKDLKDHPEILEQELLPPVVILALPRTGSTKLQRMLGESNNFQNLLWWQMHMFARLPGEPDHGVQKRFDITKEFEEWNYQQCPDMVKGHPRYADQPEEEQILQEFTFPPTVAVQFSGADYSQERLMKFSPEPMYDYLKMQLQYLQWQFYPDNPRPWVLKSPTNFGFEQQLINTFGNKTKIICPHRDPVNVVCSIAKTSEYYRKVYSDISNKEKSDSLANNMLNALAYGAQQHLAFRDNNPEVAILDVGFKDIHKNPVTVLRNIYEFLDLELSQNVESKVQQWDDGQRKSHKSNEYSLEESGLTQEQIDAAFDAYLKKFSAYV